MLWWTLRQLNSQDPAKRERAIAMLQPEMSNPRVRSALVRTLADDADCAVCAAAAGALGRSGGNEAIAALVGKLEHSTPPVASAVCAALVQIGVPAVEAVGRSMLDKGVTAPDSVRVLEAIGGEGAASVLLGALANGSVEVIHSLGRMGEPRAIEPLVLILEQGPARVAAAEALGKIPDERVVAPLVRALSDVRMNVAATAARSLEARGWQPRTDTERVLRARGLNDWSGLNGLGDRGAAVIEELRSILGVATTAAFAGLGRKPGVASLVCLLVDSDAEFRNSAREQLRTLERGGWWKTEAAVAAIPRFISALSDPDETRRKDAGDALRRIGQPALPGLIEVAREKSADWRRLWSAVETLGITPSVDYGPALWALLREDWLGLSAMGKVAMNAVSTAVWDSLWVPLEVAAEALQFFGWDHVRSGDPKRGSRWQPPRDVLRRVAGEDPARWCVVTAAAVEVLSAGLPRASPVLFELLAEIGDPRALDSLLRYMFAHPTAPPYHASGAALQKALMALAPMAGLSEAVVNRAVAAAGYEMIEEARSSSVSTDAATRALAELRAEVTPVTSNLLHLVAGKRSVEVLTNSCAYQYLQRLTFDEQCDAARGELARRGNPPYRPEAYLRARTY